MNRNPYLNNVKRLFAWSLLGSISILTFLAASVCGEPAKRLFPAAQKSAEWINFSADGYESEVCGIVYRGDNPRPLNGMPLGGIDTGCLDIESSGSIGWSTIFNHLTPRGGPVNVPILGVSVQGKTWLMATGEGKRHKNPNDTGEVPSIFDLGLEGVKRAHSIDYWGHYPILDMEYNSDCPVTTGMRAWSPFIPGDTAISNTPGAVFEVHLRNPGTEPLSGTAVFNFPGFSKHRPDKTSSTPAHVSPVERPYLPGGPPFDGTTLPEKDPQVARPDLGRTVGGKMAIGDPSLDGINEVVLPLKDTGTGRGILISFQRTAATYGGAIDGGGVYEYEVIDILESNSITAVTISDYDGDGKAEIIAGSDQGEIFCYRRREPGFISRHTESLKAYERRRLNPLDTQYAFVTEVRVGDLTGDGKADLAFTTGWREGDPVPGVFVIVGDKTVRLIDECHSTFNGCAIGDFDSDGQADLAIASKGGIKPEHNYLRVLTLGADASIRSTETVYQFELDRGPQWVACGDFDGNGQDDLLVSTLNPGTYWFSRDRSPLGSHGAWRAPEDAADVSFSGYSDPVQTSSGDRRTVIAVGQDNSFLLQRRPAQAGGPNLGWSLEYWHTGGAPNSMQAAATGDISGDGLFDVLYWHTSHELGVHTSPPPPDLATQKKQPPASIVRLPLNELPKGTCVTEGAYDMSYALAVLDEAKPRIGGGLGTDSDAWQNIHLRLPTDDEAGGSSIAVDFTLKPHGSKIIRYILSWYAPQWNGAGIPEASGIKYTHMYAKRFKDAADVVTLLAKQHNDLLRRIISWQEAIYADKEIPGWLSDSLINILHLITECSVWGQIKEPISKVFKEEDGLFGMNECPRGCPQIECIPCSFYGNIPLPYFFPECALSTLRGYKNYQFEDGRAPWIFGGCTAQTPPFNISTPARGYQTVLNGACYVVMVDRHWRITRNDAILKEFLESVKRCCEFSFSLRPAYGPSQVIAMPTGNVDTEWFEAPEPGWQGYITHGGGIRLAQAAIAKRMAEHAGDQEFVKKCEAWLRDGSAAMEKYLWAGEYYYNFHEPETNTLSAFVFGYQLDGEWIADWHGLPNDTVFPASRVLTTLETIKRINCALSESAAVNYANPDGSPAKVGGYGPYSYFPPEAMMLAMNFMYEGHRDFGLDLLHRTMRNIACKWGYTWDAPNIMRGDQDTGQRTFGSDYYQDMMLWAVPAALQGADMAAPCKPGGLVARVIEAGR